jgi:hypothetical protein
VLAELDYLVAEIAGQPTELVVLEDVARGAYRLEPFSAGDTATAKAVARRVLADVSGGAAAWWGAPPRARSRPQA